MGRGGLECQTVSWTGEVEFLPLNLLGPRSLLSGGTSPGITFNGLSRKLRTLARRQEPAHGSVEVPRRARCRHRDRPIARAVRRDLDERRLRGVHAQLSQGPESAQPG